MASPTNTSALLQRDGVSGAQTIDCGFAWVAGRQGKFKVSYYNDSGNPISSLSMGGSAATLVSRGTSSNGQNFSDIWFVSSVAGGTNNLVLTPGIGTVYFSGSAEQWASGAMSVDAGCANNALVTSTTPAVSLAQTTSTASSIIDAVITATVGSGANGFTGPTGTGWTATYTEQDSNAHQGGRGAWKEETTTGVKTATFGATFSEEYVLAIAAFTLAGATGAYTLTAERGTYTFTGQASNLLKSTRMTADQGTYSVTGQDALLGKSGTSSSLTADVGLFTLFGSEALRDISMTAEQGSYAVTGQTLNLLRGYRLTAAKADFLVTGRAATLNYSQAPATPVSVSATGGTVYLDSGAVYVVSAAGRTRWVDYIPVRQVSPGSGRTSTFAQDGAIPVTMLASITGLREWVDYIPVVEVADSANVWRTEADGWLPIISV
jgi:hypothetical protein